MNSGDGIIAADLGSIMDRADKINSHLKPYARIIVNSPENPIPPDHVYLVNVNGIVINRLDKLTRNDFKLLGKTASAKTNILYRGDTTFIPLNKMDPIAQFDNRLKESLLAFNNTPGLYFTNSKDNALSYGTYLTSVKIRQEANILDITEPLPKPIIAKIVKSNPNINDVALDWNENSQIGIQIIINSIMKEDDPMERLKAIWAEAFPNDNQGFVNAMTQAGFDGIKVPKMGVDHYVIYNTDILDLVQQEKIA
jgi:hypothetical protein